MNHATITAPGPVSRLSARVRAAPSHPGTELAETIFRALGLGGDPFLAGPATPDSGDWIAIQSRAAVLGELTAWITDPPFPSRPGLTNQGLAVVTGEAGSGRTSLLAAVAEECATRSGLLVATVVDDGNRRSDALLLRAMIASLDAEPAGRTGRELIAEIRALLAVHVAAGRRPLMLIDNAAFSGSQLEILRMVLLPAGDDDATADARLVLFGPPELRDRIRRRRALAGMVDVTHELARLEETEIATILNGRVEAMRPDATHGGDAGSLFTAEAIDVIGAWSGGNLAGVIRIGGRCLREAIARGRASIDSTIARFVARDLTGDAWPPVPARVPAAAPYAEPVVQTKLALGFADEASAPGALSRPARNRGRRS